jgi:predicted GIY-YIG superfamily endonuclease/quercetin dioxygenase-like cupin family protein
MNLFDFPEEEFENEITRIIHKSQNIRIEKIVSDGQTTDWYDQEEAEWVCLLEGRAELEFENRKKRLKKGEAVLILPHERHRVSKTSRCIWLCVFFDFIPQDRYYVYILKCADDSLYCGYTDDIKKRVKAHNCGKGAKYTKSRLPAKLVYSEEFYTKPQAMRRECEIKKLPREKKLELIEKMAEN